jgi:hypothetical protein
LSDEQEIRDAVDAAKARGTFNIVNVLAERAYPKSSIVIHLDEQSAYDASVIKEELDELLERVGKHNPSKQQQDRIDDLTEQVDKLSQKMVESGYIFHIKGISEGKRETLFNDSKKKYPVEYEKPNDLASLTGQKVERVEKESPERDQLFTDFLWREHIYMVEDPDGNTQTDLTYSDIKEIRSSLPLSSLAKINQAIEKIRTSTAIFMMETGEDFLAKP